MMRGSGMLLAGVLCAVVQGCAVAPVPPSPVCGDAGVLRQVDEGVRLQGRAMVIEAPPVGEVSSDAVASPPLVHCAVRGHIVGYDTNRYGASPVNEPFIVRYTVELRRNGLFVQVE